MSEQDGIQSSTKQRRSRKTNIANHEAPAVQRPANDDTEAWKSYWKMQGQPWRTEPEIDEERQKYLAECRSITPHIGQSIYPFKGIKLNRADIEWLLATHENGRGPVDWNDPTQRGRSGLDLRGVNLIDENLQNLPLARLRGGLTGNDWRNATKEQRHLAAIHLERTNLYYAHLEGSILTHAHLQGAKLNETHMESIDAYSAHFEAPVPANLRGAFFDTSTKLERAKVANEMQVGIGLLDVHWGDINLTGVDWSSVRTLFEERKARDPRTSDGQLKDQQEYIRRYQEATRAYFQLAQVLQQQGVTEDAALFAYRAQLMQRIVFRRQRKYRQYLFSLFIDLLAGYGYKPGRSFIVYALVISLFATIYHLLGTHLAWNEALVISMTAFHGRGFFPDQFHPGDPQALVAALEAFVGLLIEVTFIATLTQRLFRK